MKVTSQGYNTWKVQVRFPGPILSAAVISQRLADVKSELARQFGVPDGLLEYTKLLKRESFDDGVDVQIQLVKKSICSGAPQFRLLPMTSAEGSQFSDMILEADLYPFDEFEQLLTFDKIQTRVAMTGVDLGLIDWARLKEALARLNETYEPVFGLQIANGELPDFGIHSQVNYGVGLKESLVEESAWIGTHPVSRGDILVEVGAARPGRRAGRNLLGVELEPRPGVEVRLEAGEGAERTSTGARVVATADGLVRYRRIPLDRRARDARDLVPARLLVSVTPCEILTASLKYDLDVAEPLIIRGNLYAGSRIRTKAPLVVEGYIEEGSVIDARGTVRIRGDLSGVKLTTDEHLCILGQVKQSMLNARLTLQIEGTAVDCTLRAMDIIAHDVVGGDVEALSRTMIGRVFKSSSGTASVRINLRKYLQEQQLTGRQTVDDIRESLHQIALIFGHETVSQVEPVSVSRLLLSWLRDQKRTRGAVYSSIEVQEFRMLLEMIPVMRQQLSAAGAELRDITQRLGSLDGPVGTQSSSS